MSRQTLFARFTLVLVLATALALPAAAAPASRDWPTWAGPNHDLTIDAGAFNRDTFGLEAAWVKALGSGYSGIVVVDDRVITGYSDGENDVLVALDAASGDEIWSYTIAETYKGHDGSDDGPISTPAVEGDTVYGFGPWGHLFAVALADGKERWARQLPEDLAPKPEYGFTTAPTMVDDVLVIQTGGPDGFSICGFDPKTGELLWSSADDAVSYQSPMGLEIGGETQVIALTDSSMMGIAPKSGKVLWTHAFDGDPRDNGTLQPIRIGPGQLLAAKQGGATLYKIAKGGDGYGVEELWTSRAFRNTWATPVPYEGHVYGFAGNFLTCADAKTGEVVWKSRPPGGGNLVLVDGHLVIQNNDGDIVIAEATPDGYNEKTRLKALDRGYLTRPSFGSGRVYVRNLTQIASIGITDAPTAAPEIADLPPQPELRGKFGAWVKKVHAANDKTAMVEAFVAEQDSFPVVEKLDGDTDLVHFVFHEEVDDLALSGSFLISGEQVVMPRIPGTDFYHHTVELPDNGLFVYRYHVFEDSRTDPRNSHTSMSLFGESSELHMPGWKMPAALDVPDELRGRLDTWTWTSKIQEDSEREVTVYLPPGFDDGKDRYPLLVVGYGTQAVERAHLDGVIDNLIAAGEIAPLVVAFVPRRGFDEYAGSLASVHAQALAKELVPHFEKAYRVRKKAADHAIWGAVSGASLALNTAASHPGAFGKVALQSFYFGENRDAMEAALGKAAGKLHAVVEKRAHDYATPQTASSEEIPQLVEMLEAGGAELSVHDIADGFGWASWRSRFGPMLAELFPPEGGR